MADAVLTRPDVTVRSMTPADLAEVIPANNAEIPAVSHLHEEKLELLVEIAETALVAEVGEAFAGFVLALPAESDYTSPNYDWFVDRFDEFVYIDRIVVSPGNQGLGIGRSLYDGVIAASDASLLVSEVNTDPRNDQSLAFHDRYGFTGVGSMVYGEDQIECVKLAKPLA